MDRERERDAAEGLIEEADAKLGDKAPDRDRPGQGDDKSPSVDSMKPSQDESGKDEKKKGERHGRI